MAFALAGEMASIVPSLGAKPLQQLRWLKTFDMYDVTEGFADTLRYFVHECEILSYAFLSIVVLNTKVSRHRAGAAQFCDLDIAVSCRAQYLVAVLADVRRVSRRHLLLAFDPDRRVDG